MHAEQEALAAAQAKLKSAGSMVSVTKLVALTASADGADWTPLPAHKDESERLAAIIHSSGSTGVPKGAMLSERALSGPLELWRIRRCRVIGVGLAPLNHIMGRTSLASVLGVPVASCTSRWRRTCRPSSRTSGAFVRR